MITAIGMILEANTNFHAEELYLGMIVLDIAIIIALTEVFA